MLSEQELQDININLATLTALKIHGYEIREFTRPNQSKYRIYKNNRRIAFCHHDFIWRVYSSKKDHLKTLEAILGTHRVYHALL